MKICDHCGASNEDSTRFCTTCGAKFPERAQAYTPTPDPEPEPVQATSPEPFNVETPSYSQAYQQPYQQSYQGSYQNNYSYGDQRSYSGLAVAGFVTSLVSLLCCGITSFIGLILSIAGAVSASKKEKKGMGLAIAGIIISALFTFFWVFSLVVSSGAIKSAIDNTDDADIEQFLDALEDELNEEA
ncbi:MAG: DUF4190 domain-containing protein [Clostridiales bacterium]|nr:DUF4190 domain-containing protein [Clostridiales bacterium]